MSWYRLHDIIPPEEGEDSSSVLIVTRDSENGAIDSTEIEEVIRRIILIE